MPRGAILQTSKNSEVFDKNGSEHISELSSTRKAKDESVLRCMSSVILYNLKGAHK